jgi:HSP20 family protein
MIKIKTDNASAKVFFDIFADLFNEPIIITDPTCNANCGCRTPVHDVIENDTSYVIQVTLPGIKKEDTSLDIEKDMLIVKAERKENKDWKYNRKEIFYGKYERSFLLPDDADRDNIDATFTDGILSITVPKIVDAAKLVKKKVVIK